MQPIQPALFGVSVAMGASRKIGFKRLCPRDAQLGQTKVLNLCVAVGLAINRSADFARILSKFSMTLDLRS